MATEIERSPDVQRYMGYMAAYEKAFDKWCDRSEKIVKRYRDDAKQYSYDSETARFNILWSNVQTLVPATFSRIPQPDVSRRFRDSDPVGRVASLILERALDFEIRHYSDYRETLKNCIFDRFLGGRGVAWVRYEPKTSTQEPMDAEDGSEYVAEVPDQDPDIGDAAPLEQIDDEKAAVDYVHWRDFGHTVARTWEEVTCVWRRVYMGYPELCERFGEEMAMKIPLDATPPGEDGNRRDMSSGVAQINKQAEIYEIWDKTSKTACWLSKKVGDLLDVRDDPLGLEDFWPCPRPIYATITTDSLVPVPDFIQYQDQANELDVISDRVDGLIKALRVRGVYNAQFKELQRLFTETGNNDLIPVKDWMAFAEKGGLDSAIGIVDLTPIAGALQTAFEARRQIIDQVYEITGISDIMRGDTEAQETATAQGIKSRFGALRLRNTQEDVALFATDLLRLKAQVICGKFSDETILKIASVSQLQPEDQALVMPALAMLRNSVVRDFRIEIDADSLVQMDEQQTKQERLEFMTTISGFLEKGVQAAIAIPEAGPAILEMMKFGISAFKAGKTLEGMLDSALQNLQKDLAQQQSQPKPPPLPLQQIAAETQGRMQELQAKGQQDAQLEQIRASLKQQEIAAQVQAEREKAQISAQVEMATQQMQAAQAHQQNQLEAAREALQARNEASLEAMRMQMDAHMEAMKQQVAVLVAQIAAASRIEVAETMTGAQLEAAQIAAANQAETTEE